MELTNLSGVKSTRTEALMIGKSSDVKLKTLKEGKAFTTAGDNGAINVWMDDEGGIRCQAYRYLKTVDQQKYSLVIQAQKWVSDWLVKIQ